MRIAICDDEEVFLSQLKDKLYIYFNNHNLEVTIDSYNCGTDLIRSQNKYNIIILDYQMNKIDGLETAKKLREGINALSCLIFLTSYPEIAISAYDVDTYRFVLKNTLYDGLFKALDDFRKSKKSKYIINVKTGKEFKTINTENITFIETKNKESFIHLLNSDVLLTKNTLTNLYSDLPKSHFFKVHKAYVINFAHIIGREKYELKIRNYEYTIPISRNAYSKFKKTYYNFLKDSTYE